MMRLSTHAKERWQQRCSHLDLEAEWAAQRPASKRLLNMLRRSWERSQGVGTWPAQYDYWVTPGGAVFVADCGAVITVMTIKDIKRWDQRATADDRLKRRHVIL